jgi:ribosomal protein S12 methylthiotransferase accessory factor
VWVPFERVNLDLRVLDAPGMGVFVKDSNGLASGNTLAEAILHGLYELIERDAWALDEQRRRDGGGAPNIDVSGCDSRVDGVLLRCDAAGVTVIVREITSDIGVPVFEATLIDERPGSLPPPPPIRGFGCHLESAIAVLRAITEAAQGRLTVIAGSRDDLGRECERDPFAAAGPRQLGEDALPRIVGLADLSTPTIEGDIASVLARLRARGFDEVVAVDLSPSDGPAGVARVVVPGLEAVPESRHYRPGPRALAVAR